MCFVIIKVIKNIKNVAGCRDTRTAKSKETRGTIEHNSEVDRCAETQVGIRQHTLTDMYARVPDTISHSLVPRLLPSFCCSMRHKAGEEPAWERSRLISHTPAAPCFTGCRATTFTVQVCMYTTVLSCAHLILKVQAGSGSQEELHHLLVATETGLL